MSGREQGSKTLHGPQVFVRRWFHDGHWVVYQGPIGATHAVSTTSTWTPVDNSTDPDPVDNPLEKAGFPPVDWPVDKSGRPLAYRGEDGIWIDPGSPNFSAASEPDPQQEGKPKIYLFSSAHDGDGMAYAMAEDGTVIGSHWCSHWGYMQHDLHDRPDRKTACEAHYPDGYQLVVLWGTENLPAEVYQRNQAQRPREPKVES